MSALVWLGEEAEKDMTYHRDLGLESEGHRVICTTFLKRVSAGR